MRKIIFIIAVLLSASIISCSGDSDSDVSVGYIDPGLGSAKTVNANKSYSLTLSSGGNKSVSGVNANSIIYLGAMSDATYVGIAVDNLDNSTATSRFSFKIYWPATEIPEGSVTLTSSQYSVKVIGNGNSYSTTNGSDITMTINKQTDDTYNIQLTSSIVFTDGGGNTLTSGATPTIRAYKYP